MSNYCQIQVKNETHSRLNKIRGNNLLEKGKSKSFSEIINDALDLLEKQELKSEVQ
jgi:Arc/MetJ-type ribon-helix-helix transcriptional regulator